MSDNEEPQREEGCEEQNFQEQLEETQRLTTQWSVEDEEEAARERRRRERQQMEGSEGQSPDDLDDENTETDNHAGMKPAGPWETEEDEGFSDWSQKLEQRKLRGAAQAAETEEARCPDKEETEQTRATEEIHTNNTEEDEGTTRNEDVEVNDELEPRTEVTEVTEVISFSQWETREVNDEENRPPSPRVPEEECEEQEEPEEKHVPASDQVQREQYQDQYQYTSDVMESQRQSVISDEEEGDETITVKVTERTEILNRSIQKSNSIKRSEPPLPIHKIDDFLEQYTHAIETSAKPGRLVKQPSLEMLSPTDGVSNIKNRWETGDVTTAIKASPCKDTEGINIGVSDMINQWGKGKPEPEGQGSPPKLTEVKPGEVLSKKSLWEHGPKSGQSQKNTTPTKKYKFVPVGHGKYEKVLVDEP